MKSSLYVTARYFVAFFRLLYGFAKIDGSQSKLSGVPRDRPAPS